LRLILLNLDFKVRENHQKYNSIYQIRRLQEPADIFCTIEKIEIQYFPDEPADLVSTQPQKITAIENEKLPAKDTVKPPSTLGLRRQNAQARRAALNPNRLSIISSSTGSPDDGCGSESVGVLGSTSESSLSPETAEAW
jgi:hypothetical protein